MRQLKRSECAILPLVLKRKWYDMISSGEKREEYRDDKPHWRTRIKRWRSAQSHGWDEMDKNKFLVIGFSCGYRKPDMFFLSHMTDLRDYPLHPEWGEPETPHYALVLRERVEIAD